MTGCTVDTSVLIDLQNRVPYARPFLEGILAESGGLILTAPVYAEVLTGIAGAKTRPKDEDLKAFMDNAVVIPFDKDAATIYAQEVSRLKNEGVRPTVMDAQIASIAIAADIQLATRDLGDFARFEGLNIRMLPDGPAP